MSSIFEHQAYLLVGNIDSSLLNLKNNLEKYLGKKAESHPDYYELIIPAFDVKNSRELR